MAVDASARAVLEAEWAVVRPWIDTIPEAAMDRPSVLEGWTVRDLIAHVSTGIAVISAAEPSEAPAPTVGHADYVGSYPAVADRIAEGARRLAAERRDDLGALLDSAWAGVMAAADGWGTDERRLVEVKRGTVRVSELLQTRILEVLVHGDDLARSVPEIPPPAHDRGALREMVKLLLGALVERAPGRSVEVRVPPFAAVQVIEGTSHTRGTPPNTVEADPLTWIRVACGRIPWADAEADGTLRVSGTRAPEVATHLPLL